MSGDTARADLDAPPPAVLAAWNRAGAASERVRGGLINATFLVRGGEPLILQRLHPVFAAEVNLDIEAVTEHLAAAGLVTPRLVRTAAGDRWLIHDGAVWRAQSFIDGVTMHEMVDAAHAAAAGELVGRFHRALSDLEREFAFPARRRCTTPPRTCAGWPGRWSASRPASSKKRSGSGARSSTPARVCPRWAICRAAPRTAISRCPTCSSRAGEPVRAVCLIDLDTLSRMTIAYEMGRCAALLVQPGRRGHARHALRRRPVRRGGARLCRRHGRPAGAGGDRLAARRARDGLRGAFRPLLRRRVRGPLLRLEPGPLRVAPAKHNLVRARGQLTLARAVAANRGATRQLLGAAFG